MTRELDIGQTELEAMLGEAAADNKRLRAEVEAFRGTLAEQCGQTLVARAEVERLTRLLDAFHDGVDTAAEVERLTALLKVASRHVEREGDISLLTDIQRALEQPKP